MSLDRAASTYAEARSGIQEAASANEEVGARLASVLEGSVSNSAGDMLGRASRIQGMLGELASKIAAFEEEIRHYRDII